MSRARALAALASAALLTAGCANLGSRPAREAADNEGAASLRILVTVAEPRSAPLALAGAPTQRYLRRGAYYATSPAVEQTLDTLAREYSLKRVEGWPIGSLGVYCEVFEVPADRSVETLIAALARDARVDLAQRMNVFETRTVPRYDDPYASLQWSVPQLAVAEAHQMATGEGVLVALIDSGVDARHPDLAGRISVQRNLVGSSAPAHGEIHGTAVAGIIASLANNHEGIVGIAPDVTIAALRACWAVEPSLSQAHCSSFSLARAMEVALTLKPRIINLSLVGPFDPLLSRLLDIAIERGIVVVAAAPDSADGASFPASHADVIVARTANSAPNGESPYVLAAPGTEILTTTPDASYSFLSGSSLAAAHVSGVVALLLQVKRDMATAEVASLLAGTTTYSAGTVSINACLALEHLMQTHSCPPQIEIARF
jgi:subtilisin family serine protease